MGGGSTGGGSTGGEGQQPDISRLTNNTAERRIYTVLFIIKPYK